MLDYPSQSAAHTKAGHSLLDARHRLPSSRRLQSKPPGLPKSNPACTCLLAVPSILCLLGNCLRHQTASVLSALAPTWHLHPEQRAGPRDREWTGVGGLTSCGIGNRVLGACGPTMGACRRRVVVPGGVPIRTRQAFPNCFAALEHAKPCDFRTRNGPDREAECEPVGVPKADLTRLCIVPLACSLILSSLQGAVGASQPWIGQQSATRAAALLWMPPDCTQALHFNSPGSRGKRFVWHTYNTLGLD